MFGFLKWFFPLRVKTLDEFVVQIRQRGGIGVLIRPEANPKNGANTYTVGMLADWQYELQFWATTLTGRPVYYLEFCHERYGSNQSFIDTNDRAKAGITMALIGVKQMSFLKDALPGVRVEMLLPNGEYMNEGYHERLRRDAARLGVQMD